MPGTGPGPFVADIGPKPGRLGFAGTRSQQLYRRVVGKESLSLLNIVPNGRGQTLKQRGGFANPVGQGGAIQINAIAIVYLTLPVQRQVIAIFGNQHMSQKSRTRTAPLDGPPRQGGLMECLTAGAGHARTYDPVHHEASGDIFQFLRDIFPKGL